MLPPPSSDSSSAPPPAGRDRRLAIELKKLRNAGVVLFVEHPRTNALLRVPDPPADPVVIDSSGVSHAVNVEDFCALMWGHTASPYAGCGFVVHIVLPSRYPVSSPSVAFRTRIVHPNVAPRDTGAYQAVCCSALNADWATGISLAGIVTTILPEFTAHPNSEDPLDAATARECKEDTAAAARRIRRDALTHAFALTPEAAEEARVAGIPTEGRVQAAVASTTAATRTTSGS